jgi:5''-nucleotidase/2'',3''-cyclic phosphodiesterase and related esterases
MMRKLHIVILLILGMTSLGYAQNFQYGYEMIRLTSQYDKNIDPKLQKYVDRIQTRLNQEMGVVIGQCDAMLSSYDPASPLSNFLTDILLEKAPDYAGDSDFRQCDLSLLNFGGIRSELAAGDVTVGDIFAISPFENYLVFLDIKGRELRKMFNRFEERKKNAPYAGAKVTYHSGHPIQVLVQGKPIDDERTYRVVTLNFIAEGGDNILSGIKYERTHYTQVVFRDFLIREIRNMTQEGRHIVGKLDNRVVIKPMP